MDVSRSPHSPFTDDSGLIGRSSPLGDDSLEATLNHWRWIQGALEDQSLEPQEREERLLSEMEAWFADIPESKRARTRQRLERQLSLPPDDPTENSSNQLEDAFEQFQKAWNQADETAKQKIQSKAQTLFQWPSAVQSDSEIDAPWRALKDVLHLPASSLDETALLLDIFRAKLNLRPDHPMNLALIIKLTAWLVESTDRLDRFVRDLWRRIAPESAILSDQEAAALKNRMATFLEGLPLDERRSIPRTLESLNRLILGLINAPAPGGRLFLQKLLTKLAPEEIQRQTRKGGSRLFQGIETASWESFENIMNTLTLDVLEREFRDILARSTEDLYHSGRA